MAPFISLLPIFPFYPLSSPSSLFSVSLYITPTSFSLIHNAHLSSSLISSLLLSIICNSSISLVFPLFICSHSPLLPLNNLLVPHIVLPSSFLLLSFFQFSHPISHLLCVAFFSLILCFLHPCPYIFSLLYFLLLIPPPPSSFFCMKILFIHKYSFTYI